jgi:hypothetical protein
MPAVAQPIKPPVVQGNVIALYAQGQSKRRIAKDLGIARATVDSILQRYSQNEPISASRVQQLIPLAYDAVETGLRRGDARIGMDFLKATDLATDRSVDVQIKDATFNTLVTHIPAATSTPSSTSMTSSTESTATEAAAKPPGADVGLSSHTNFSQFSTADLLAELARRGHSGVAGIPESAASAGKLGLADDGPGNIIEAEVVGG